MDPKLVGLISFPKDLLYFTFKMHRNLYIINDLNDQKNVNFSVQHLNCRIKLVWACVCLFVVFLKNKSKIVVPI